MNRLLLPVLLLLIFIFGGWGGTGHKIINRKSVESFPQEMSIFNNWAAQLESKASDADYRKGDDPDESPKHYIDIDNYSDFVNTGRIPQTWDSVSAIYGYNFVINQGTLPWAILAAVDSIQKAFEREDIEAALLISADLGHYVADAHNPLHITKNYNGQLTGQNGIHSRYESSMINNYQSQIQYTGDSVAHIEDLNNYVFSFIYRNYEYVDSVLNADKTARTYAGSTSGSAYYQKLWENSKDFTLMLFKSASKILAELIYTAWKNAGSPGIISEIEDQINSINSFELYQNYPNPFNPTTKIKFTIPSTSGEVVSLKVYDILGNEIAALVNEEKPAGEYEVEFDAENLSSGVYYYLLRVEGFNQINKMVYLK